MPDMNNQELFYRDGAGQRDRLAPALLPEYFRLDDRGTADLMRFARALAQRLRYVGLDNLEAGDWSNFPGADGHPVTVEDMAAFLEDPGRFAGDASKRQWLSRPHFALLLVFLDLLRTERDEINRFTQRHLDYYYRDILGLKPRPAEPDYVHLLLEPAKGVRQYQIEKDTPLLAGKTPEGRNRQFRTTEEIVVGRAKVAALKVFFQDRGYRPYETLIADPANLKNGYFLKVAVGNPAAGYVLPKYPSDPSNGAGSADPFFTDTLTQFLRFSNQHLFLNLSNLRRFVALKDKIEGPVHRAFFSREPGNKGINYYLKEAWSNRTGSKPATALTANDWDFEKNFNQAIGTEPFPTQSNNTFTANFQGIRHVQDLYERILDLGYTGNPAGALPQELAELQHKISTHLFFANIHDFMAMMKSFQAVQDDWKRLNLLLLKAAQGAIDNRDKGAAPPVFKNWQTRADDIRERLIDAVKPVFSAGNTGLAGIADIQAYWNKVLELERYFQLPAEEVLFLLETWKSGSLSPIYADRLVEILKRAQQKTTLQRDAAGLKQPFQLPGGFDKIFEQLFGIDKKIPQFGDGKDTAGTLAALYAGATKGAADAEQYIRDRFFMNPLDFITIVQTAEKTKPGVSPIATNAETDQLYQIVAAAVRRKNDTPMYLGEMTPRGLFSSADARLLRTDRTGESHPRWTTLGQQIPAVPGEPAPFGPAQIGFAIQSPLLWLEGGERTITLKIRFAEPEDMADPGKELQENFEYRLSNDKEANGITATWKTSAWKADSKEITITLELPADQPAVTAPHPDFFPAGDALPVLKMCLKQDPETGANVWAALSAWVVQSAKLSVSVNDLLPTDAWNDEGEIDPKKPFQPFGMHPRVGSAFSWAHWEVSSKRHAALSFTMNWMDRPDPDNWPTNYPLAIHPKDDTFTINILTVDENGKRTLIPGAKKLFPPNLTAPELAALPAKYDRIVLELRQDFGHSYYLKEASKGITITQTPMQGTPGGVQYAVPDRVALPYTPRLKSFAINYTTTTQELSLEQSESNHFFHLNPFGPSIPAEKTTGQFSLLPALPGEGALYIGLKDVDVPAVLSLLFQTAEGTADPDAERRPLRWQYLAADGWRPRPDEQHPAALVVSDDTDGLNRSGIIRFSLPEAAGAQNPEMPTGLYWLRVSVDFYRRSVCDLIDVHAQAVQAVRALEENGTDDPGQPLPPGTVTALAQRRPEIRAVQQPYTSRNGRSPESDTDFYARVAERLRHKQRALMGWDIERLVLQAFPDIYKVKCLPAGWQPGAPPGTADVVLLPNLRGRLPMDPFQPRLAQARLQEIGQWLQARAPIPAQYRVRNARFIVLSVEVTVQFHTGSDPGYYRRRLSEELAEYLSPWAFDTGADIHFGGRIYPAQVLVFIETRPYVDFVSALRLNAEGLPASTDAFSALDPPSPDTVWVSNPTHDIRLYTDVVLPATRGERGIEFDAVGVDFGIS